jgi:hypothetical protein
LNIEILTVVLIFLTCLLVVLTALTVHNRDVTAGVAILAAVICASVVVLLVRRAFDRERRSQKVTATLAHKIEVEPGGVAAVLLLRGRDSKQSFKKLKNVLKKENERLSVVPVKGGDISRTQTLLDDLSELLQENERLAVVRLDGRHILEAPPGIPEDGIPFPLECLKIVGLIGWGLEKADGLSDQDRVVARELRAIVTRCLQQSDPPEWLLHSAAERVKQYDSLIGRLVLLAYARPEALQRRAGKWLLDLLKELGCTFGVLTQEHRPSDKPGPAVGWKYADRYAWDTLSPWLSEDQVNSFLPSLRNAALDSPDVDLGLLKIRCAVLVAAVQIGKQTEAEAIKRLPSPDSAAPNDLMRAAALEACWVVDRKAERTGVLERLALVDEVTPEMFAVLLRDLKLDAKEARHLFTWLRNEEFGLAGIIAKTEDAIRLGSADVDSDQIVRTAIEKWLGEDEQSERRQQAQIAAERCYRECLILDPAHLPGAGYIDWMKQGYAGFTLVESVGWQENARAWYHHAVEIESPEKRKDAGVAITCLFLDAWWWWGDQVRHPFVDTSLDMAKGILRGQPEWISALEEFNDNYVPEFDQRAGATDKWPRVAHALDFLADRLELRQGTVPPDRVLRRIYLCWCSFSGDVSQHTGDLEAADTWFRLSADACENDEDGSAMRAFSNYQRADVWIPSDPDRSLRIVTETGLADEAVRLEDLELQSYTARLYGDIRWNTGNVDGAFDAYGRALLLSYIYQVDQESQAMLPTDYTYRLYSEMRSRFLARLDEVREKGLGSAADAAAERVGKLFGPYWALHKTVMAGSDDRLKGIAPPLPDQKDLAIDSDYVRDAQRLMHGELREQIAEPVDRPLPKP